MAKKKKDSKNYFNREITIKTSLKKKLIEELFSSIIAMIILYLCLTNFNEFIVSFFSDVAKKNIAINVVLIFLPMLFIVKSMITIGLHEILQSKEKK